MKLYKEFLEAIWEVFKLPFFLLGLGFKRMYNLGWRKLTMLIAAAIILTVVVFGLFFEISSQPAFCKSCHIMKPYIFAWEQSSHSDVSCMKCHAGTKIKGYFETKFTALSMLANYFTGLYKRSTPGLRSRMQTAFREGAMKLACWKENRLYNRDYIRSHSPLKRITSWSETALHQLSLSDCPG